MRQLTFIQSQFSIYSHVAWPENHRQSKRRCWSGMIKYSRQSWKLLRSLAKLKIKLLLELTSELQVHAGLRDRAETLSLAQVEKFLAWDLSRTSDVSDDLMSASLELGQKLASLAAVMNDAIMTASTQAAAQATAAAAVSTVPTSSPQSYKRFWFTHVLWLRWKLPLVQEGLSGAHIQGWAFPRAPLFLGGVRGRGQEQVPALPTCFSAAALGPVGALGFNLQQKKNF